MATVVVTGASSGIGRATARAFAERGDRLVLVARRADVLDVVADECRQRGGEAVTAPADVADAAAVERIAGDSVQRGNGIDVWVNAAAVNSYGALDDLPADDARRVIETNLVGTLNGSRVAVRRFRQQGHGVLVNVSSLAGRVAVPLQAPYVASKAGILGLTAALNHELRDLSGVHACAVLPGPVDTPLFRRAANHTGRRVVCPQPAAPPQMVAAAIVALADRPRAEVVVGGEVKATALARRLAPGLVQRVAGPAGEATHLADEPAAATSGNLHEPVRDAYDRDVDGGWGGAQATARKRRGAAAAVAVGVLGAVVGALRRRGRTGGRRGPG